MTAPTRWVHLNMLGGDHWVLPIWNALNNAAKAGRVPPITEELGELGFHISTRLDFLPRIVKRLNYRVVYLYEAISNRGREHEFCQGVDSVAFDFDSDLKFELLIDLDSLLFELNSVCELIGRLFESLHTHAGQPMPKLTVGSSVKSILQGAGKDTSWFVKLNDNRNFFMHQGTPYVAVDVSNARGNYDLLIMKEDLKEFNNPTNFVRLSEINDIVQGFQYSRAVLQDYLVNWITSLV